MEMGEKIRAARLEAGLSQRQLCGDTITRNMLSQIENGSARPSMDTLKYLAGRLGKSVSYFLEEQAVTSPNQAAMAQAREAYRAGDSAGVLAALEGYQSPDPIFDDEKGLLVNLSLLVQANDAIRQDRLPYARTILERWEPTPYETHTLRRDYLLLLAQADPSRVGPCARALPDDDGALLLRGRAALEAGDAARCLELLSAAGDHAAQTWQQLRGDAYLALEEYALAAACFEACPEAPQLLPKLERCYRELGDFKKAYEYACKQR